MMTTKRNSQSNGTWQYLLGYFSIALLFPSLAFSDHYLFTDLGENQIPIALSDNDAILIEERSDPDNFTRYILANGVKIRTPEGATITGLNEWDGKLPALALVGKKLDEFATLQPYHWQLNGAGLNPIKTAVWNKTDLPIEALPSQVIAINGQGTVLGQGQFTTGKSELFYIDIDAQGNRNLIRPVQQNDSQSGARAINATGDIAGVVTDDNNIKYSYLYRQDKGKGDIITLTDNYIASETLDLSDRNANGNIWVVGKAQIDADRWQAYVATGDNMDMQAIDTNTLDGGNSVAKSVNNTGDVVGQAQDSQGEERAFLYRITKKEFIDLNDHQDNLFVLGPVSLRIATDAIAINHHGSIVGTYTYNNQQHGYLLTTTENDPPFPLKKQIISCRPTALDCLKDFSAQAIAIDNGWMALGQYEANKVTLLQQGNNNRWLYHSTLRPNDIEVDNQFGFSVALQAKRLVVGANFDNSTGTAEMLNVGAIYIYDYDNETTTWKVDKKILPNPSQVIADLKFGNTVSVYDNRILVTAEKTGQPGFYYVKLETTWEEFIINTPRLFNTWGRLGKSFAVLGYRSNYETNIYPVIDSGRLGTSPLALASGYEAAELHDRTIVGRLNASLRIIHNKESQEDQKDQWHHQANIIQPAYKFTFYKDTLVTHYRDNILSFFNRSKQETWHLRARHLLAFIPNIISLNRDILAISSADNTKSIEIFSLPSAGIGADLTLAIANPMENNTSKTGEPVTYQVTITNQDLDREAWNVQLQIDVNNDRFIADESDPRCLWLAKIARVNCALGSIVSQASISLPITLQHQSPQLDFTVVQQGTDPKSSNNTVIINTQFSDVEFELTMVPDRTEITPNGIVHFAIKVQNNEAEPIITLLTMSTDDSVAYAGDSCENPESLCNKVGKPSDLNYTLEVPPEQSKTFTVTLRFPLADEYAITINAPLSENIPAITHSIQVGSNVPDIRILTRKAQYLLKENEALPSLALTVRNWALENKDTGKHIDWALSKNSILVQEDHTTTTSVNLGSLEPGDYTFQITLLDINHGSTNYQDQIPFTVQRPPPPPPPVPSVTILQPADNSTFLYSPRIGFDLQLDIKNWPMRVNGKHYRWIWDGKETGSDTALTLKLSDLLSTLALAEGPHQLTVDLIDENGDLQVSSNTITITIKHPNDVTVHWSNIPDTVVIAPNEQTAPVPVKLTLINNNKEAPATDVRLSLFTRRLELTQPTTLAWGCELTTSTAITCQFPSLAASEQRDLSLTFTSQQGTAELSAEINQANSIDPVFSPLFKTIQILDPIDLSIESTWQETNVRVNQTLQPIFTITNQHPDRTATTLTVSGTATLLLSQHPSFNLSSGCEIKDKTWQCMIDTLAPGESRAFDWSFIAMDSGSVDYQVTISNTQDDTNPDNNTQTTQITLTQPNPKITILQPTSTQTIYRHPLPSPADNRTYASSVQLHYRIDDWDQSERGIPHQVTINGELVATRNEVSPLDITHNVIDGDNTIVIQLLDRDDKPLSHSEVSMSLKVAKGTIVDVPEPKPPVSRGALGGWLLLGMGLWGWRRLSV